MQQRQQVLPRPQLLHQPPPPRPQLKERRGRQVQPSQPLPPLTPLPHQRKQMLLQQTRVTYNLHPLKMQQCFQGISP